MQIYLPIAEMSVNGLLVLIMGGVVGFLSGMFGVGGGFLMTPLLIFIGVPPAIAVGTQANQLVAASVSGVLAHWRRKNVDVKLGLVMLIGGAGGTALGVWIFGILQTLGQIDLVIALSYVLFLGGIGGLMLVESVGAMIRGRKQGARRKLHKHTWLHGLPFKMRFQRSRLFISALLPAGIGFVGGLMVAIMGIGGGFLLVPALIYLIRVPTGVVIGTSMVLTLVTMAYATVIHAATNQLVDAVLALILMVGGVIGAQFGARTGQKFSGEQLRLLLGILVLAVGLRFAYDLVVWPAEMFTVRQTETQP